MQKTINSTEFRKMILCGARLLENNRSKVDALNVFPVPDGDTGTNMSLTMQSAVKELSACPSNAFMEVCDSVSKGALKGARGNSGVILSQILRGICSVLRECGKEFDTRTFAKAMEAGTKVAYGAVSVPKEGTILTVVRMMSEHSGKAASRKKNFEEFFADVIAEGDKALALTPELLPVLKKAGVVDSGGVGLMTIFRGFLAALTGEEIAGEIQTQAETQPQEDFGDNSDIVNLDLGEIQFAYCTEFFIINLKKSTTLADIDRLRERLMNLGDSVICIGDLEMVKVHVHTNDPGLAIQKALKYGALSNMKIDNMRLEHHEKVVKMAQKEQQEAAAAAPAEKKAAAFIAVSVGEGINAILKDLGVDYIIEGGQTMNPSTEDVLNAIEKVNAETVYVLPNNKNIILAANQAKYMTEDKKIVVIPTKTIAQGITAVINYVPDLSPEENEAAMTEAIETVRTGEVTYAVRDTVIDDHEIHQGDYMGIGDAGILAVGQAIETVTKDMIDSMMDEDMELISIYYGQETKEEDAAALRDKVAEKYPACDVELQYGGQPIYYYIVSAE